MIPSGIRDSSHRPQANVAQGIKTNHNVLSEDNDWRGEAFHLPINIDASIFDGLDDTTSPIISTATILGDTAIAMTAPIAMDNNNEDNAMEEAIADANEMFNNIGITTQYEQVFDNAMYVRDLPTLNMTAWVIPDVRTDTTFTELWETYLLHMEDTRVEVTIQLIRWTSLLGRTSHEGLLEQLRRYEMMYGSINRAYILVAFGRVYRLVEGARALMDRTDWYSFQDLQRHM
jgi:hypothetical protein